MGKLYFTSYAHEHTRDSYLKRFVDKLRDEVLQRAPGGTSLEDIVFVDRDAIKTGADWVLLLADAVRNTQVCLAVYSPAYFSSEYCGKEIQVFLQRMAAWQAKPENANKRPRVIIPVIWIRAKVPECMRKFQEDDNSFPSEYRKDGLRTLWQLNKYRDKRTQVTIALAENILAAARETELPPGDPIPDFNYISNVFREQDVGFRYGIALLPLIKGGGSVVAYPGSPSLADVFGATASTRNIPWREMPQGKGLTQRLKAAQDIREGVIALIDFETITDPSFQNLLREFDEGANGNCAILVLRRDAAGMPDSDVQLEITLQGVFPKAMASSVLNDWTSIRSPESLRTKLEETMTKLRHTLIAIDPARKAEDALLQREAAANGIPIDRQPMVTGPGGSVS